MKGRSEEQYFDVGPSDEDDLVTPEFLSYLSFGIELSICVHLLLIWVGFFLSYLNLLADVCELGSLDMCVGRFPKVALLFGQVGFVLAGMCGLYLYRGQDRWKLLGMFISIMLGISAFTSYKLALSLHIKHAIIIFFVMDAISLLLMGICTGRYLIGPFILQAIFPFVYTNKTWGITVSVLGLVICATSYGWTRWKQQKPNSEENAPLMI